MPACLRSEPPAAGRLGLLAWTLALLLLWPPPTQAHASSQAYLQLSGDATHSRLQADLALRDLDAALDLDADGDGLLTWGELRQAESRIQRWVSQGVGLSGCTASWQPSPLSLVQRSDGLYTRLVLTTACPLSGNASLRYHLLAEVDPTHRALLRTERAGQAGQAAVLSPARALVPDTEPTPPVAFWQEGIHHLLTGHDHLLFLLCLLLPALPRRQPVGANARTGTGEWTQTLRPIVGWVTAFTLAHSVTLGLAVLAGVRLPGAVIEPLIAASIVLAALDNLRPFLHRLLGLPRWGVALGFGLVHGFGFAGALGELDLPAQELAWALLQFNLGLELAQLGVVALAVAALWRLRRWSGYARWVQGLGSALAAALGTAWVWQRLA